MKHPIKNLMKCTANRRAGISIIEVLTSLVVAAIGVSGVLVLIPFAVKQSQLGIERDLADVVGINASEELQIRGFTSVSDTGVIPWSGGGVATQPVSGEAYNDTTAAVVTPGAASALTPQIVHLDPLAVTTTLQQRTELGLAANFGFPTGAGQPNPDVLTRYLDNALKIPVANLNRLTDGAALGLTEARLLTQSTDRLVFSDTDYLGIKATDIDGPQPAFTLSAGGSPVSRQYQGRISWSAVMVPEKATGVLPMPTGATVSPTPSSRYRMYTLVYADRNARSSVLSIDSENGNDMFVAHVPRFSFVTDTSLAADVRRTSIVNPNNLNGGFVRSVSRIVLDPAVHTQADGTTLTGVSQVNIVKDDWVMLINRKLPIDTSTVPFGGRSISDGDGVVYNFQTEEAGYDLQVAFCRVTSVDRGADNDGDGLLTGASDRSASLSVEGGPFDFYYEDLESSVTPTITTAYTSNTYVVHLKDVINVFERTITLE